MANIMQVKKIINIDLIKIFTQAHVCNSEDLKKILKSLNDLILMFSNQ